MKTKPESLLAHTVTGAKVTQKQRILRYLENWQQFGRNPSPRDGIASDLELRITSVCARLNELVAEGKVLVIPHSFYNEVTRRWVDTYRPVTPTKEN